MEDLKHNIESSGFAEEASSSGDKLNPAAAPFEFGTVEPTADDFLWYQSYAAAVASAAVARLSHDYYLQDPNYYWGDYATMASMNAYPPVMCGEGQHCFNFMPADGPAAREMGGADAGTADGVCDSGVAQSWSGIYQ